MVKISCSDLQGYLRSVLEDFPVLKACVDLQEYTRKLCDNGVAFAAASAPPSDEPRVYAGIVSGYFNNVEEGFAYISILHVRSEYRKSRIGRMLVDKALSYSKEQGLGMVKLHVNKTNGNAIRFYEHLGFGIAAETGRKFEMQFKIP